MSPGQPQWGKEFFPPQNIADDFHFDHFRQIPETGSLKQEQNSSNLGFFVDWAGGYDRADDPVRVAIIDVLLHAGGELIVNAEENNSHPVNTSAYQAANARS